MTSSSSTTSDSSTARRRQETSCNTLLNSVRHNQTTLPSGKKDGFRHRDLMLTIIGVQFLLRHPRPTSSESERVNVTDIPRKSPLPREDDPGPKGSQTPRRYLSTKRVIYYTVAVKCLYYYPSRIYLTIDRRISIILPPLLRLSKVYLTLMHDMA